MSEQDPIDPSKMIDGGRAQTQSYRKEEERRNANIAKRGRGRRGDDWGTSQATQPEKS